MFSGVKLLVTLFTVGAAVIYFLIASGKLVKFLEKARKDTPDQPKPDLVQPDPAHPALTELVKCPACGAHTVMPCACGKSAST